MAPHLAEGPAVRSMQHMPIPLTLLELAIGEEREKLVAASCVAFIEGTGVDTRQDCI
jgi:hypothetical protein